MTVRTRSRLLAALAVSVLVSAGAYRLDLRNHAIGKQAFLARQADVFDKTYAQLHPISHFLIGVSAAGAFLGAYELITMILSAAARPKKGSGV
jgi:hypothetical protein